MLDPIYIIIFGLTSFNVLVSLLRHFHFIQLKEYRFDRFRTLLLYENGLSKLTTPLGIFSTLGALYSVLVQSPLAFLLSLIIGLSSNLWIVFTKGVFRFKPTKKAILIFLLTLSASLLFFVSSATINKLNLIYILSLPLIYSITALFMPITRLAKDIQIQKATQKLKQYSNLKVIGITGSYGKSSTKEFLYQIVSPHLKTIKTPKNINTDIGVANFILKTDFSNQDIFIVEMGAYQKGEIAKICKMVKPSISIITAVHNQHLSLYGSQKNIAKAKFEIVDNLRPDGWFIQNLDSPGMKYIQDFLTHLPVQKLSISKDTNLQNITQKNETLQFQLNQQSYQSPITGKHFAENLSLSILAAQKLSLTEEQINQSLKETFLPSNTFSIKKGIKNSIIYDDSYNSSPAGFHAIIGTIENKQIKGKKILITRGMLELGTDEKEEHIKIANRLDANFDLVIIISHKTFKYFQDYLPTQKLKYITDPDQLIQYLDEQLVENSLVLLENRVPSQLHNYLLK
jgi:UDP-N-acetylmuramoyl-tripeptide--D-alanyl-D-alanine ligase